MNGKCHFEIILFGQELCADLTIKLIIFSDHAESRLISEIFITPPGRIMCFIGFKNCYYEKFQLFQPMLGAMEKFRSKIQSLNDCPCSNPADYFNNSWSCIKQRRNNLPR